MPNNFFIDATTRNAVYLQRLANGEYKKAVKYINELERQIGGVIATGDFVAVRQQAILLEVARLNKEYLKAFSETVAETATKTATYSAGFEHRLLTKGSKKKFKLPDEQALNIKALTQTMEFSAGVQPLTIQEALNQYTTAKDGEIRRVINEGIIKGLNKNVIIENVSAVTSIARKQANALVRTMVNSSANVGRLYTMLENKHLLDGYEWVAKLDGRTTEICSSRDGTVYPFTSNSPMPPAHWNCRSQIVPVIKE